MRERISLMIAALLLFGALTAGTMMKATAVPEPFASIDYEFTGDEADAAGFAQGRITVTPEDDARTDGYYLLYYADDREILQEYDMIAALKITGKAVSHTVGDGIMLPPYATRIVAIRSDTRTQIENPTMDMTIGTPYVIPEEKRLTLGDAEFTFGAVADVHMDYQSYERGAYEKWTAALTFFTEADADRIIVAGDMTGDTNLEADYKKYIELIEQSDFPIEKIHEGIGNHGNLPTTLGLFTQYTSGEGEVRPYDGSAYFSVLAEGETRDNLFVFMAQELDASGNTANIDNFSKEQVDWLEALLAQYADTETNIFLTIHSPFLNFGAGEKHHGGYGGLIKLTDEFPQNMRVKALLETYKDVIVMSGHTHLSLYDGENYSDEYNSFARTVHLGSTCFPCAYGAGVTYTRGTDGWQTVTPAYGSEASLVQVYGDYIVYTGYNLSTGKIIPAACLLLPVHAYGGEGKPETPVLTPEEAFEGNGTAEDPYLIANEADFFALTCGFNASVSENDMYGKGLYFKQTADIDMRSFEGYEGTTANGNAKCYFAGVYDGNGYSVTVDINAFGQRSVFPYLYGTILNTTVKGSITATESAQPIRTSRGSIINCFFDLTLSAAKAHGLVYSNYGYVYNVYTRGTLIGEEPHAVAVSDSSTDYVNLFHFYTLEDGTAVADSEGVRTDDAETVLQAFNDRDSARYQRARGIAGGDILCLASYGGTFALQSGVTMPEQDAFAESAQSESSTEELASASTETEASEDEKKEQGFSPVLFALFGGLAVSLSVCLVLLFRKKKKA